MKTYYLANPLERDTVKNKGISKIQYALKTDKFYTGPVDGIFGAGTAHAAKVAKWRFGYPEKLVLPSAGETLYDFLTGKTALPASYRVRRHLRGYGVSKTEKIRDAIVAYAQWGVQHEPSIHYRQIRPMPIGSPYHLPMYTDCSGYATLAYKVAGGPDPNGGGFSGQGYTGTMLSHGHAIPLFMAKPGDLVIWGAPPDGHHVAIVIDVSDRGDPILASHGQEAGPVHVRLSVETAAQRRSYVVRRYLSD